MMNLYGVLKFLHVLSVVFWIGGVTALWITTLRIARAGDYPTVARLLPVGMAYGHILGATLVRKNWMRIGQLVNAPNRDDAALSAVLSRTTTVTWIYLTIMIIVIAAMVLKP